MARLGGGDDTHMGVQKPCPYSPLHHLQLQCPNKHSVPIPDGSVIPFFAAGKRGGSRPAPVALRLVASRRFLIEVLCSKPLHRSCSLSLGCRVAGPPHPVSRASPPPRVLRILAVCPHRPPPRALPPDGP